MNVDLGLYAIVDPSVAGGRTLAELARQVSGSATLVQMRDKHSSTRVMIEEARAIQAVLNASRVPLLVNDRVDVALVAEADGVHIGQDDMPAAEARLLLGRSAIIGLSLKSVARGASRAARASRLCRHWRRVRHHVQGEYRSADRPGRLARDRPGRARPRAKFPICAIAGINESNAAEVIAAGADGVAVISALSLAPDPALAAKSLRAVVDRALAQRGRA